MVADRVIANSHLSTWDHRWINILIAVAVIFSVLPAGFTWREFDDGSMVVDGSWEFKLQWGSLFALSAYVVYRHIPLALANLRVVNPFLLLMLVYAMTSTLWSPADSVTVKKAIQFGGLIVFALAVQTSERPWHHFVFVIQMALFGIEIASAIAALGFPSLGIDSYFGYAWRGILSGKNTLGGTAALSLIFWAALWHESSVDRRLWWWGAGLSAVCVVMSKSSTAITTAGFGVAVFWLLKRRHVTSQLWLLRAGVMAGLVLLVFAHLFYIAEGRFPDRIEVLEPFANLFGKSADLTGRSDIWDPLAIEIEKHWLFGIGYGAFWLGPGSASQPILDRLPWVPFQGHNGYLDLINELGAVGMTLFVCLMLLHVRDLFQMMRIDRIGAALFASMQTTLLVSNLTESSIFRGVTFQFWLFLLICVSASATLRRQRWAHMSYTPTLTRSGKVLGSPMRGSVPIT